MVRKRKRTIDVREALRFFIEAEKAVTDYENGEWSDEAVDADKIYRDIEQARKNAAVALTPPPPKRKK